MMLRAVAVLALLAVALAPSGEARTECLPTNAFCIEEQAAADCSAVATGPITSWQTSSTEARVDATPASAKAKGSDTCRRSSDYWWERSERIELAATASNAGAGVGWGRETSVSNSGKEWFQVEARGVGPGTTTLMWYRAGGGGCIALAPFGTSFQTLCQVGTLTGGVPPQPLHVPAPPGPPAAAWGQLLP